MYLLNTKLILYCFRMLTSVVRIILKPNKMASTIENQKYTLQSVNFIIKYLIQMFSHTGIIGNEKVDKHIKDVITSINDVEYDIKWIAKQKIHNMWQNECSTSN